MAEHFLKQLLGIFAQQSRNNGRGSSSGSMYSDESYSSDEEEDEMWRPATVTQPRANPCPDTSVIDESDYKESFYQQTRRQHPCLAHMLRNREIGATCRLQQCFTSSERHHVAKHFIPNQFYEPRHFPSKVFCGMYSKDGDVFVSACQDRVIRLLDTKQYKVQRSIEAKDVGWSILDVAFSPDKRNFVYSSWSQSLHLCSVARDINTHVALNLLPDSFGHFCIFSLKFSSEGNEILGGANEGSIYLYDLEHQCPSLAIRAHDDDVNAVAFADDSSQILFSGSDDGLVKAWDRRTLSEEHPIPVGQMAGHTDGVTFIDPKGDGRHLLSNSKDQTIKLWDIRRFSTQQAAQSVKAATSRQNWDYRWQPIPRQMLKIKPMKIAGDTSLMTYRGHAVLHTLIRARFSPAHTTGQRYIYTGCATGSVIVYDSLTGKIVKALTEGHNACVRDVSWHPYDNTLVSTSWDHTVGLWRYAEEASHDIELKESGGSSCSRTKPVSQMDCRAMIHKAIARTIRP